MMTKNNKMNLPFIEPLLDWLCTDVAWTFVCTGACDSNFEVTVLHISNILDVYIFVIKSNNLTKKKSQIISLFLQKIIAEHMKGTLQYKYNTTDDKKKKINLLLIL